MADTAAQQQTLADLRESYGEGEVTLKDERGIVFTAGEQNLLLSPDGVVSELPSSTGAGGAGSESSAPAEDATDPEGGASHASSGPSPFPVNSFRDAALHLRRPFTDKAVKWKVQATWSTGGLVVPYIDARLVIERLNLVCPHLWHDEYEPIGGGKGLLCRLTIDHITRQDVGSGYQGKGLYSDAFKRAAVKFGIGVSLYALPKIKFELSDGFLRDTGKKDKKGKPIFELTDTGIARCQSGYRAWLKEAGEQNFGEALDHGDVAESYGDVEAEVPAPVTEETAAEPEPERLTDERATELVTRAETLHAALPKGKMTKAAFQRQLESVWSSHADLERFVETLEGLGDDS